jgi:multiple antibiotic resistance protein
MPSQADLGFGLSFLVTLFSVLNPPHAVPLYLAMVPSPTAETTRRVARIAALTVFVTLGTTLVVGDDLLDFFGITVPAFQVGGGLLILLMGLSMLQGQTSPAKSTPAETEEAAQWREIAVVPLGTPMLAGAGAMSTVIVFEHDSANWPQWTMLGIGIVLNVILCWLFLRYSEAMIRALGRTGVNVISRLMGMILVAMAIQFMSDGIHGLFPGAPAPP